MRQKLVAGNWKLNGSKASIESLMGGILAGLEGMDNVAVAVCPPYVYIPMTQTLVAGSRIGLGSQDIADQDAGAFTGEVSGAMLKEFGCDYAIVGHSERRAIYGEQDADTARKFAAARKHGLKPILCVGETLEEREAGITEAVVARQLDAVIALEGVEALTDGVIAYEPVWAIGTGKTASPEQAQQVHAVLRAQLAAASDKAARIRLLYGGSMNAANAAELLAQPDIDGGLVGGASLKAADFLQIVAAAQSR